MDSITRLAPAVKQGRIPDENYEPDLADFPERVRRAEFRDAWESYVEINQEYESWARRYDAWLDSHVGRYEPAEHFADFTTRAFPDREG